MARESSGAASTNTSSWSDNEKITLLLQIIQTSNITPQWQSVQIPRGRTLQSAQSEFVKMSESPAYNIHRQSLLDNDEKMGGGTTQSNKHGSSSDGSTPNSSDEDEDEEHGSGASTSYNTAGANTTATTATGISSVIAVANAAASGSPGALKRKRGRPTKAESEARKAAIARGELPPPKPPSYTPVATPVYTVGPDGKQRRRRGRPSKAEVEARRKAEEAGLIPPQPPKKSKTQKDAP